MLMPILAKLADEFQGSFVLAKVNSDAQQELAMRYGVRSLPTVKVFRHGQIVDEFMGAIPESNIRALLEKHVVRESDRLVEQARSKFAAGEQAAAMELMERATHMDPDNPRARTAYAQLAMQAGDSAKARAELDSLPMRERDNPEVKKLYARLEFAAIVEQAPPQETLEKSLAADHLSDEGQYQLAAYKALNGDCEHAIELLFSLLQRSPSSTGGGPKQALLAVFELAESSELVNQYRRRMFNLLH
jgi:putative thioredoxin